MLETVLAAVGLGIAGIDPLGAILLMSAIAAQFTRTRIILFTVTVFLSTIAAGTILSLLGAGFISSINDFIPVSTSSVWLIINLVIATIILVWLVRRKLTENKPKKEKPSKQLNSSFYAVIATGILFGAGSVFDPTFLAAISLAAQSDDLFTILLMHSIWIIISQIMLFVLFIAYLYGKHEKVIAYGRMQLKKHTVLLQNVLYVTAIAVFILLVSDSLSYALTGKYLINL